MDAQLAQANLEGMPRIAIILAGGLGTRLSDALPDRPKVLAMAANRPFLDYLLTYLAAQGIERVLLCVGHLAAQVRAYAGDGSHWGIRATYSEEPRPLGTGGALRLASEKLNEPSFFALNGDTLFQVSLSRLWQAHHDDRRAATLALRRVRAAERTQRGCVILENDGRISRFDEKPGTLQVPTQETELVNGGLYLLEKRALDTVAPGASASLEEQVFPELVRSGQIGGIVLQGYFADIGTPDSLNHFEDDVTRGIVS
jgi:NDP-sugar pyrophosphorylase family protein